MTDDELIKRIEIGLVAPVDLVSLALDVRELIRRFQENRRDPVTFHLEHKLYPDIHHQEVIKRFREFYEEVGKFVLALDRDEAGKERRKTECGRCGGPLNKDGVCATQAAYFISCSKPEK